MTGSVRALANAKRFPAWPLTSLVPAPSRSNTLDLGWCALTESTANTLNVPPSKRPQTQKDCHPVHLLANPEVHIAPAPGQVAGGQRTASKLEEIAAPPSHLPGPEVYVVPCPVGCR